MRRGWAVLFAACMACGGRTELDDANDEAGLVVPFDAGEIEAAPSCDPSAPFGTPVPLDAVNTPFAEDAFRLTSDELTAYFASNRPFDAGPNASPWRIYTTRRASVADPFGDVAMNDGLTEPNSGASPLAISGDGRLLLYGAGCGPGALNPQVTVCQSTRQDTTTPFSMGVWVSIQGQVLEAPYMLPDGLTIYFYATMLPGLGMGVSRRQNLDPSFPAPTKVTIEGIVVDPQNEPMDPVVTPDERTIFFSWPATTSGPFITHIWQASRASTNDPFGSAAIVSELASPLGESPTWVSPDGCRLYFSRVVSSPATDIFVASRPLKN